MIFDLDGVLSDAARRQHYLEGRRRDWDAFFDACGEDPLVEDVAALLELLEESLAVVLLSARPLRVQAQTLAWLRRYQLRWDLLVMRDRGSFESARDFKAAAVEELRGQGFDLRLSFEDDQRNVEMFRTMGVRSIYIHSGYYG